MQFEPLMTGLLPKRPRRLRGRRAIKIVLRAIHVLAAGILVGLYVFEADDLLRDQWLLGTIASGFLMLVLDLHESGVFLLQVRGLVVVGKIGLLAVLPFLEEAAGWILAGLLVASVLSSHAPGRLRYLLLFGNGRFTGTESKG